MKCEMCSKSQKELNADCVFNEWLCDDCYCKYDWHKYENATEKHNKVLFKNMFNKFNK